MRVGIFAGGFKPFHIGHFSRLCQAIDSCDKTYVFYGTAARQKGSKFNFTEQDATAVFDITSRAIKKTYGEKVEIVKSLNPVTSAYDLIIENHSSADTICVYGRESDLSRYYLSYIGTNKEQKYFGNMINERRLVFNGNIDIHSIEKYFPNVPKKTLHDFAVLSGSDFRKSIESLDLDFLFDSLPPILTLKEKFHIVSKMCGPIPKPFTIKHIEHPYEVHGFTISELHDLINDIAIGAVDSLQEKMDGQNLTFTVKDGELVFLSKGPDITRVLNSSKTRQQIKSEYSHIPELQEAFLWAMDLLEPVVLKNSHLFRDGLVVVESALLHSISANTIAYKGNQIRLINPCSVIGNMSFDSIGFDKMFSDLENETLGIVSRVPHIESIKDCDQSFLHSLHDQLRSIIPANVKTIGDVLVVWAESYLAKNTEIHESLITRAARRLVMGHKSLLTQKMCKNISQEQWEIYKSIEAQRSLHMMRIREPIETLLCELHNNLQSRVDLNLTCSNRDDIDKIMYRDLNDIDNPAEFECLRFLQDNFELMDYTEGIVFRWRGRILKLTGNFTRLNHAKWIQMRRAK